MTAHGNVILLDGGMGQELLRHASAEPTPLWSAQVMLDQPELVVDVHRSYLDAGADAITTNAYSATRCRLAPYHLEHEYERLQRLSGQLAVEARGDRRDVMVAGCLSPYRWTYRPELAPPYEKLWPQYAESAGLQAPYVDVFLCETMGSIDEARAAVRGAATTGKPVWVSWTIRDDTTARLRSGESLRDAVQVLEDVAADAAVDLQAVLVNCSVPEAITAAVPALTSGSLRTGAYANGFHHIVDDYGPGSVTTELDTRTDVAPEAYADIAAAWIEAGLTIVGGCCEIGPDHIAELASRRRQAPVRLS